MRRATIASGAAFAFRPFPINGGAAVATRAAVRARAALVLGEQGFGRTPQRQVASNLGGGAAVQPIENVRPILRGKLVQQLVGADHTHLAVGFVRSEQISHRLGEVTVVVDADRSPWARTPNRAPLPPTPQDDDQVTTAEDRARNNLSFCADRW
jgi:hypothetical protein